MTCYEEAAIKIMEKRSDQEMRQSQQLHDLRMKWEQELYKKRLEILILENHNLQEKK